MKKIRTALMLLMLSVPMLRSQSSEEHFKFKGIPITGSKENFVKELKKQGFKSSEIGDEFLKGIFAQRDCYILINTTPITKQAFHIIVLFDDFNNWNEIKNKFDELEKQLYLKYKVSPQSEKEFFYPYEEGDGFELTAIKSGKINYYSIFKLEKGVIHLTFYNLEGIPTLALSYIDNIGNNLHTQEESQLLQSDL